MLNEGGSERSLKEEKDEVQQRHAQLGASGNLIPRTGVAGKANG